MPHVAAVMQYHWEQIFLWLQNTNCHYRKCGAQTENTNHDEFGSILAVKEIVHLFISGDRNAQILIQTDITSWKY